MGFGVLVVSAVSSPVVASYDTAELWERDLLGNEQISKDLK